MKHFMEKRLGEQRTRYEEGMRQTDQWRSAMRELLNRDARSEPSFLLQRLWRKLGEDAYALWVQVQNVVGNSNIFEVFRNPKKQYAINYDELNRLIMDMQEGVATRDFAEFKRKLRESFLTVQERTARELEEL